MQHSQFSRSLSLSFLLKIYYRTIEFCRFRQPLSSPCISAREKLFKTLYVGYIPNEITALSRVIFRVNIIYELLIRLMSLFTLARLRCYMRMIRSTIFRRLLLLFFILSVRAACRKRLMSHYNNCIYISLWHSSRPSCVACKLGFIECTTQDNFSHE